MPVDLFDDVPPVSARQPNTGRLIIRKFLDNASRDIRLDQAEIAAAHAVLVKWAELETSGKLAKFTETQVEGKFLTEIFGEALGYQQVTTGGDRWHLEAKHSFGSQTPDAMLGQYRAGSDRQDYAVIELKGPLVDLDRDRSQGRTAVDQCWDYLVNRPPTCRWGIVSNIVSFRLYERENTKRVYEHFTLQGLRELDEFRRFYVLLRRQSLIEPAYGEANPRTLQLLFDTANKQRSVGDELYESYSQQRYNLVDYLYRDQNRSVDEAVEIAQRLLDRVIFIAFCEDRDLLPPATIAEACKAAGFLAAKNPRWQNFKNLFGFIDRGSDAYNIPRFNGGLFAPHAVDELDLPDEPWTNYFRSIGQYDFRDEVNLDVLGHLFERSITELEKLKETGFFAGNQKRAREYAEMPQSAKRKLLGVYYTPPELTSLIVRYTVDELIEERLAKLAGEHGVPPAEAAAGVRPAEAPFWQAALAMLQNLKVVDPACGSGAFLFQAYNVLEQHYLQVCGRLEELEVAPRNALTRQIASFILSGNLYGVDLSPEAVEITQLALWIRSATRGQTLAELSENIVHGNSLVHDPQAHPAAFNWRERFPAVFNRPEGGFDCVVGNPPWERIKLQEREFFSLPAPEIATATNAAKRRTLVATLEKEAPELFTRYQEAQGHAEALLDYCRASGEYPLCGRGDINLYAVFAELAYNLVSPAGRVGLLTPSGIASDKTTKDFFAALAENDRLIRLYDFENRTKKMFPDVDGRFKFCILNFGGTETTVDATDFAFFIHDAEELKDRKRHIKLSGKDIKLLNPNTRTCPIFRSQRDAEITKRIYRRVPVLVDHNRTGPTGNAWGAQLKRKFDQDTKAEWFKETHDLISENFSFSNNRWIKKKQVFVPLYEAKMVQAYDHRAADAVIDESNWVRQGQKIETSLVGHQNPEHGAQARFTISEANVIAEFGEYKSDFYLAFKKITSATNTRTMIAAFIPDAAPVDSLPFIHFLGKDNWRRRCCMLGNLNSHVYDFVARQKVQGNHLQHYHVEQLPTLPPDAYDKPCPWKPKQKLEKWISERVLKLSCTAEDMLPLADACGFTGGSFKQAPYNGRLHKWDDADRAQLQAELDAAYFHLYGISREDAEYILSTFTGIHEAHTLLKGPRTKAEHILAEYDSLAADTT